MKKIFNFVLMDFVSIKSAFKFRLLVIFVAMSVVGFLSFGTSGISLGGFLILSLLGTHTFSEGQNGLDRFYISLHISRKDVVFGRYVFVFALMVLATFLYLGAGVLLPLALGYELTFQYLPMMFGVFLMSNAIFSISLPLFFKWGYKKARPVVQFLPLVLAMGLAFLLGNFDAEAEADIAYVVSNFAAPSSIGIVIATSIAIFAVSLMVSLKIYEKREL